MPGRSRRDRHHRDSGLLRPRGSASTGTYNDYVATCGTKRQTAFKGQVVNLAGGGTITVVDLNGAGVSTSEENALGLVLQLTYGAFDHVFAGDLPGESPDIESVVGPEVGDVEVCKVNHHGSASSNTDAWLNAISAEVCVLSVGANPYGHPTAAAMSRIHARAIDTYWTIGAAVSDTLANLGPEYRGLSLVGLYPGLRGRGSFLTSETRSAELSHLGSHRPCHRIRRAALAGVLHCSPGLRGGFRPGRRLGRLRAGSCSGCILLRALGR